MSYDIPALLAPGGHGREFMRNAPNGGDWVDGFCDEILLGLLQPREVADFVTKYGAYSANACKTSEGRIQLNVKWDKDRGWSCYTADTLDLAMDQLWTQVHMVTQLKEGIQP